MFDEDKLYLAGDSELATLGAPSTLASWRSEGQGPAFIKLGGRVAYSGRDLNAWIESRTVRPISEGRSRPRATRERSHAAEQGAR